MNILIVGYGKMGRMIECIAKERKHNITGIIDINDSWDEVKKENVDVAIEFSTPNSAVDNIKECIRRNIPIVVGTTGWYDYLPQVENMIEENDGTLMYSSNFAIGVYLFRKLNKYLANLMKDFTNYSPSISEIHHIHKLDAPSGTAITLANELIEEYPNKTSWKLNNTTNDKELRITSIREGEEFGTHIINYESTEDIIEIKHKALSRRGLALGAVLGAEFVKDRKGIFTMNDMLK
ncbi:MAG: 4-hydroxy-tetrahydrodipicolinate reductase [Bacteroidales bacterium]|nr:4-hydroxy-tetrahydrodipicolinate reductase [Bacteroidales bacterium]